MMRSRRELLSSLCLGAASIAAGCRRANRIVIGVVPKSLDNVFWISVHAGALAAAKEFQVEVEWNGPPQERDFSRQIDIVDALIARHVDGIALAPSDDTALAQVLDRAANQNIPVTVFDSGIKSTNYLTFIATDNFSAGKMAAETLAGLLSGKGEVGIIMNSPGSNSTVARENGFREVLRERYPNIKVVGEQFGNADRAKSRAAAENILTAHPGLDGVFCSTEPASAGAALALKSRGLSGKVKFVGFDSSEIMLEEMRGGTIDATVVQDPFQMGYQAVKTLVNKIHKKDPPKRMDLQARVVAVKDLDNPDVKNLISPDIRKYLSDQ